MPGCSKQASISGYAPMQDVRIAVISSLPVSTTALHATIERTHDTSDEVHYSLFWPPLSVVVSAQCSAAACRLCVSLAHLQYSIEYLFLLRWGKLWSDKKRL